MFRGFRAPVLLVGLYMKRPLGRDLDHLDLSKKTAYSQVDLVGPRSQQEHQHIHQCFTASRGLLRAEAMGEVGQVLLRGNPIELKSCGSKAHPKMGRRSFCPRGPHR